jgi:manganese-dependent ADP-ribose/CDP-alcohol diphosphatase
MKILIASLFASIIYISMSVKNDNVPLRSIDKSEKPLFSFGIISDVQYSDYEHIGTRFYRSSPGKLREAMTTFRNDTVSFVINLGDLIDRDFGSFKPMFNIIDSTGLKVYHVAGNHDYSVDSQYKKRLPVLTPSKKGYYSFVYKNFRFICLNGNELSTYISDNKTAIKEAESYLSAMKDKGEINAVEWNGGFSNEQIRWLKKQLEYAVGSDEKVILICHFPVAPVNIHNLLNYKEVLPLLENHRNIVAWFNGHNHAGNYSYLNMIHFVTFKGMVETESDNSFARIDVYKDKLSIRGYGREKSQILEY